MSAKVFSWGWREQPPLAGIATAVQDISARGERVWVRQVTDTGDDQYAVVVSDVELTDAQAAQLYETPDAVIRVRITIEPRWADAHTEVIDVELSEVIGTEGMARETKMTGLCSDVVNDVCSWGHMELGIIDFPDEDQGPQE